jgi:competence protein ComEC
MAGCMHLLQWAAEWPLAVWQQHAPPAWAIVAGVAGVVWMLLPRGFPLRWAGAVGLVPMFLLLPPVLASGELQVAALDVGQGTAVVLRTAQHALLYDAGPKYSAEADSGNRIVIPYLRGEGVRRLNGMLVSHDDLDHSGGALSVLQDMRVGWLAAPLPPGHALRGHARRDLYCLAGQDWTWDGVHFEMLHPTSASYAENNLKDNDRSCVLKATSAYGSVLLAGDIERLSEAGLTERAAENLKSDILLVPHHGSKTSSTAAFVERVQPVAAVFTMGYRNRFGHPKPEVVERYRALGSHLYRSDRDGAVIFDLRNPGEIEAARWRRSAPRYWHDSPTGLDENAPAG